MSTGSAMSDQTDIDTLIHASTSTATGRRSRRGRFTLLALLIPAVYVAAAVVVGMHLFLNHGDDRLRVPAFARKLLRLREVTPRRLPFAKGDTWRTADTPTRDMTRRAVNDNQFFRTLIRSELHGTGEDLLTAASWRVTCGGYKVRTGPTRAAVFVTVEEMLCELFFGFEATPRFYAAGAVLVRKGRVPTHLFLVEDGLAVQDEDPTSDADIWMGERIHGEALAGLQLLYGLPSKFNIVAKTDVWVWQLDAATLKHIIPYDSPVRGTDPLERDAAIDDLEFAAAPLESDETLTAAQISAHHREILAKAWERVSCFESLFRLTPLDVAPHAHSKVKEATGDPCPRLPLH